MRENRARSLRRGALSAAVAALVLAAVVIGMLLPSLFSLIQAQRLDKTEEILDLNAGELNITSDDIKLERLGLPRAWKELEEQGYPIDSVALSDGRFMDANDAADKIYELEELLEGTGLSTGGISADNFQTATPWLIIDASGVSGIVLWTVHYTRFIGPITEVLDFAVDESTGLIISAQYSVTDSSGAGLENNAEAYSSGNYSQTLSALAQNMIKSYNFAETEIEAQTVDSELSEYVNIFDIYFINGGETALSIPVWISFNQWTINVP